MQISGIPEIFVLIMGNPYDIASIKTTGIPSRSFFKAIEDKIKASRNLKKFFFSSPLFLPIYLIESDS